MINSLTQEQQARFKNYISKYTSPVRGGYVVNKEACAQGIDWLYSLIAEKPPAKIYVRSPFERVLAFYLLSSIPGAQVGDQVGDQVEGQVLDQVWAQVGDQVEAQVWAQVWDQVGDQVGAQVRAQVWDQVRDQVGDQVGAQVGAQVWDQVRDQVRDQVGAQVGAQVWDQVRDQVGAQVWDQVWAQVWDQVLGAAYPRIDDSAWVSYFDFLIKETSISIDEEILLKFNKFKSLLESGLFDTSQFKRICIISMPPTKAVWDNGRLHNTDGPALEFADGFKMYCINGRRLPSHIWEEPITKEKFLSERNAEIRAGMYAVAGQKKIFEMLDCDKIDTCTDNNEVLTLWRTKENGPGLHSKLSWVQCKCPSTGTEYFLGCKPTHTSAKAAMAECWGVEESEYQISNHT